MNPPSTCQNLLKKLNEAEGDLRVYPSSVDVLKRYLSMLMERRLKQLHQFREQQEAQRECDNDPNRSEMECIWHLRSVDFVRWKISDTRILIEYIKNFIDKFDLWCLSTPGGADFGIFFT